MTRTKKISDDDIVVGMLKAFENPKLKEVIISFANVTSHKAIVDTIAEYDKRVNSILDNKLTEIGLDTTEKRKIAADFAHLRSLRENTERTRAVTKEVVIKMGIGAVLFSLLYGIIMGIQDAQVHIFNVFSRGH